MHTENKVLSCIARRKICGFFMCSLQKYTEFNEKYIQHQHRDFMLGGCFVMCCGRQ